MKAIKEKTDVDNFIVDVMFCGYGDCPQGPLKSTQYGSSLVAVFKQADRCHLHYVDLCPGLVHSCFDTLSTLD